MKKWFLFATQMLPRGLFGCEILFHDACAVREFGMRDEVRHSAAPRVWRHDIIFCQNVAWRIFVMRAALLVKCGAGYRSTPGGKWRIRRLHNIMPKCSAKYFAVRMRVTLYVVWGHIQQNIISQPNRPQGYNLRTILEVVLKITQRESAM